MVRSATLVGFHDMPGRSYVTGTGDRSTKPERTSAHECDLTSKPRWQEAAP
jgi:hypothetical protein